MTTLFGLLYTSESTRLIPPNKPRIITFVDGSNLNTSCISFEHYGSLFGTKGQIVGLPSYVPQGYALQCIRVGGPNPAEEDSVAFYYYKDDKEFQSRFLPKIEKEAESYPFASTWTAEFNQAGGILVFRSIEYIEPDDPRYNDKVKHVEIERATGDPRNQCPLPEYTHGNCNVDLQGDYPPIKFANGNPIGSTFGYDQSRNRVNGLLMYMDHNWLVYILGTNSDELFKMSKTINEIDKMKANTS